MLISILLLLMILLISKIKYNNVLFEKEQKNALIGNYIIDLQKTNFQGYEIKDVENLTLSLRKDGTFSFNKDYPFVYDSVGVWISREPGLDKWNWLHFTRISKVRCQFEDSWKGRPVIDSILILNSMTPKKGEIPIYVIHLKKVN